MSAGLSTLPRSRTAPSHAATTSPLGSRLEAWADREGFGAIPALPETVAAYLAERAANGLSPASLRLDRPAIRYHHTEAGHANPADNEGVRRVLRGLTRRAAREGRTPRQAAALTEEGLAAIRATAHLRRTGPGGRTDRASPARLRGQVDIALVSVMRDRHASALRSRRAHVGPTWRFGATGPPASPSAAPRATRTAQGPLCTLGEPPRRSFGRSIVQTPRPKPRSSDSVPVGPCRTGSPQQQRLRGWWAVFRDTHPGSGWLVTWWPRARESLPSKSPDAGLPPKCPPTTPALSWPRREPWRGSTGRIKLTLHGSLATKPVIASHAHPKSAGRHDLSGPLGSAVEGPASVIPAGRPLLVPCPSERCPARSSAGPAEPRCESSAGSPPPTGCSAPGARSNGPASANSAPPRRLPSPPPRAPTGTGVSRGQNHSGNPRTAHSKDSVHPLASLQNSPMEAARSALCQLAQPELAARTLLACFGN